jgi:TolB-like protein
MKRTIVLMLMMLAACALFAQNRPRLAILPFTGSNAEEAEALAEFFSFEPEITRNFTPVPRTRAVENIMKEQRFQRSGLTDSDTISELGKQMNADYVLAGHITSLGQSKLLLITIIHVEQLRQVAGDYREYRRIEETEAFLPGMARRMAAASRQDASRLPRLAVLPFNPLSSGVNEGDAEVLSQILATDIANSGKYAVFPRARTI